MEASTALSLWNDSSRKRLVDVLAAGIALTVSSPLMLLAALAVRIDSPGPVFFRQRRVGKNGTEFEMLKFRTMFHRSRDGSAPLTRKGDSRVTRVGKILRRWKLDELPQFFNVLRGDMSLIGPRPDLAEFYLKLDSTRRQVLRLKPGITGWATLHFRDEESVLASVSPERMIGFYENEVLPKKIDLDLSYAREASLKGDLTILLQTFAAILPTRFAPPTSRHLPLA
ncbi:MAG: sugar transferase [Acidobacteriaceae bacterium]|nr:sugar transferase [Acidobacteriaceae bacterium]